MGEALHLLKRSQAVGESGIEALSGEGEGGVQELDNNIVGADATIKAWRFMQVTILLLASVMPFHCPSCTLACSLSASASGLEAPPCLQFCPEWVSLATCQLLSIVQSPSTCVKQNIVELGPGETKLQAAANGAGSDALEACLGTQAVLAVGCKQVNATKHRECFPDLVYHGWNPHAGPCFHSPLQ